MEVNGQLHASAAVPPGKISRYPFQWNDIIQETKRRMK